MINFKDYILDEKTEEFIQVGNKKISVNRLATLVVKATDKEYGKDATVAGFMTPLMQAKILADVLKKVASGELK